jgi:tyrosinase
MKFTQTVASLLGLLQLVTALPSTSSVGVERRQSCTSPRLRKSWDAATAAEKKAYIDAAVCLTEKPSRLGIAGSKLHDDFAMVHYNLANEIHNVAAFLPWHRFFVHVYEEALRTECGYTGTALYWDWVADSPAPAQASVWDPDTGFGGNGSSTDGSWLSYCVRDGPFKDWRPRWWSGEDLPHCLSRQWVRGEPLANQQEMLGYAYDANVVAGLFVNTDFQEFANWLENSPHAAVHFGVGNGQGDLAPNTSPNGTLLRAKR